MDARHESSCIARVSSLTAVYEVRLTTAESLDWMMAATRVHWFKSRVRIVWLAGKYFSSPLVI